MGARASSPAEGDGGSLVVYDRSWWGVACDESGASSLVVTVLLRWKGARRRSSRGRNDAFFHFFFVGVRCCARFVIDHQVAKAQLDEDMCVEAIASYIKAEDPSYYAEVRRFIHILT